MSQPVDNPKGPMTSKGRSQRNLPDEHATEVLESVSDVFIALDREWCCTYVNGAAERASRAWGAKTCWGEPCGRHSPT
jgi:hypothetical protein